MMSKNKFDKLHTFSEIQHFQDETREASDSLEVVKGLFKYALQTWEMLNVLISHSSGMGHFVNVKDKIQQISLLQCFQRCQTPELRICQRLPEAFQKCASNVSVS